MENTIKTIRRKKTQTNKHTRFESRQKCISIWKNVSSSCQFSRQEKRIDGINASL